MEAEKNVEKDIEKIKAEKVKEYIEKLNPLEKIAYDIAVSRLKTSFDMEKSIGFKKS
jgi:hypothetical protein